MLSVENAYIHKNPLRTKSITVESIETLPFFVLTATAFESFLSAETCWNPLNSFVSFNLRFEKQRYWVTDENKRKDKCLIKTVTRYIVKIIIKPSRGNALAKRSLSLVETCARNLLNIGPIIKPIPNVATIRPKYFGRNSWGETSPTQACKAGTIPPQDP